MSAPPRWITEFADEVAALLEPADLLAPLGCHCCQHENVWEITLFAARTEIIGGPRDGERRPSAFHINLLELTRLFESVTAMDWQAHAVHEDDDLRTHISVTGRILGRSVWLRVLATAPPQFAVGRQALVHEQQWKEVW